MSPWAARGRASARGADTADGRAAWPGFFEIGEELALARTPGGLLTAVVVAGQDGATLETAAFSAPPAAIAPPGVAGTPAVAPGTRPPGRPAASGHAAPGTGTARAASGRPPGSAVTAAWLGAAALCGAAAVAAFRDAAAPFRGWTACTAPPAEPQKTVNGDGLSHAACREKRKARRRWPGRARSCRVISARKTRRALATMSAVPSG